MVTADCMLKVKEITTGIDETENKMPYHEENFLWLNTPIHRREDQSAVVILL